jgi:predicted small secreted protein
MEGNAIPIVIMSGIAVAIIAVVTFYIVRFMRGSIKLLLPRTTFNPGDTITGSFDLVTKKPIQGNKLTVSLVGVQVTRTYEDGKTRTRSHEIYRHETLVEEGRAYPAGHTARHNFEIIAPDTSAPEFLNSPLGKTLTAALHLLSNRNTYLKWKVEARLDASGADLVSSTQVSINMA